MESYLGRLNYNYDNRYLLTATFRRDGSPNFGADNRWGNFPFGFGAWRINKEKFFDVDFISELKLRFETGLTGNQGQVWYLCSAKYRSYSMGYRYFCHQLLQILNLVGKKLRQTTLE
jgi:hypothetical protein